MTLSPSEGTCPEPTWRSKALTPPEFGSSKKSDMADLEEKEGGGSDKINVQQHAAEVKETDKALLVVVDDDDDDDAE